MNFVDRRRFITVAVGLAAAQGAGDLPFHPGP